MRNLILFTAPIAILIALFSNFFFGMILFLGFIAYLGTSKTNY